jgi:uncharacterized membrane-anchored protein YjiN (DUF445 family)
MKRRATGLLALVAIAFVALAAIDHPTGWVAYALAAAEGSMVGGLADWFAVTALFRHPLGIPIPHTAIIRERKEQFGATLGTFVQESFLTPEIVGDRIREAGIADRTAAWLADPANADTVGRTVLEAAVSTIDVLEDDDVARFLQAELERAVDRMQLAPLAGRFLAVATREGRHNELFDALLRGVITLLDEQREPLRERFGEESPWWLPGAVEDRLFDRIIDGARMLMATVVADPHHELRKAVDGRLAELAERLQDDPALATRSRELGRELMQHDALREWTTSLWADAKQLLRDQAPDPSSEVRTRLASLISGFGARLQQDPALRQKLSGWAETAARQLVANHADEIGNLIASTVALWDGEETSDKLELLLGRDLQFIRINGTVVGGLAGLALHGASTLLH